MSKVKLLVWNMEWMNDLFVANTENAAWRADSEEPQHAKEITTIKNRREDLAGVLNDLAPDIVVAVEAPNRREELDLFFSDDSVTGNWAVHLQRSPGQSQCVGIGIRMDQGKFQAPPIEAFDTRSAPAFDPFLADTDGDKVEEQHRFERRPLYVEVRPKGGKPFRVLGLHLKSKAIFGAHEWSRFWQLAEGNRKKLLAQATQLRLAFLDPYLTATETKDIPLIVCGDINDGPGLDAAEKRIFGSAVERLMGTVWHPDLCLGNAVFDALKESEQKSLDFSKVRTSSFKDPIFNSSWQRSWIDHVLYTRGGGRWVKGAKIHDTMPDGDKIWEKYPASSDHHPITVLVQT